MGSKKTKFWSNILTDWIESEIREGVYNQHYKILSNIGFDITITIQGGLYCLSKLSDNCSIFTLSIVSIDYMHTFPVKNVRFSWWEEKDSNCQLYISKSL